MVVTSSWTCALFFFFPVLGWCDGDLLSDRLATKLVLRALCFVNERVEDGSRRILRLSSRSTEYPESGADRVSKGCEGSFRFDRLFSISRSRRENLREDIGSDYVFAEDWRSRSSEGDNRVLVGLLRSGSLGVVSGPRGALIDEDLELMTKTSVYLYWVSATIEYLGGRSFPCVIIHKRLELRCVRLEENEPRTGYAPSEQMALERAGPRTAESKCEKFSPLWETRNVFPYLGRLWVLVNKWAKGCKPLGRGYIPRKALLTYLIV